jgi:hypothetical protein
MRTPKAVALILFLGAAEIAASAPVLAGCGDWEGRARVCYEGRCQVLRGERHCSSVGSGNSFKTLDDYDFWFDNYIGGYPATLRVERHGQVLYKGDALRSPWTIFVCGDTIFGNSCEEPWINPASGKVFRYPLDAQ